MIFFRKFLLNFMFDCYRTIIVKRTVCIKNFEFFNFPLQFDHEFPCGSRGGVRLAVSRKFEGLRPKTWHIISKNNLKFHIQTVTPDLISGVTKIEPCDKASTDRIKWIYENVFKKLFILARLAYCVAFWSHLKPFQLSW